MEHRKGKWRATDFGSRPLGAAIVNSRFSEDVWRVRAADWPGDPIVEHWGRSGWTRTPVNAPAGGLAQLSLAALSPSNAWLAGVTTTTAGMDTDHAVLFRWDGRRWRRVGGPPLDAQYGRLTDAGHGQVWLQGWNQEGVPYLRRWEADRWVNVSPPSRLEAATPLLWAVGQKQTLATTSAPRASDELLQLSCTR